MPHFVLWRTIVTAVKIGRFRSRYRPSRHLGNWDNLAESYKNACDFDKIRSLSNDGKNSTQGL